MGKLLDLALYNPSRLSDEDFLAGFVARQPLAERILSRLREIKPGGLAQHRLIVGQRGMGKTSLLRRIALGIQQDPALSAVLLPLSFREEQYNVHSLHVLWCNCLDALGDWLEASGQEQKARELDHDIAALEQEMAKPSRGEEEGSQAFELFRRWMKREGRRPLLLFDNLDIVLDGLADHDWSLRRVMQKAGGIVVVGASTHALEAAVQPKAAFYEFFQVDVLEPLVLEEVMSCLRRFASLRGESGEPVRQLLASEPARIRVLHDLTGGNPRTLAMLYLVLEATEDDDVMLDLERLLDQATPLYKARVEELAPQARVVFDALALSWDPATAADLATITTLEANAVSAQLDRLVRDGVAEKTSLSTTRRIGYQVAERFFNIWYLMRHGPRRQRQRLKWLVEALRRIYTPAELEKRAKTILESPTGGQLGRASYLLAFSDAIADGPLRTALISHALKCDPELREEVWGIEAAPDKDASTDTAEGTLEEQAPRLRQKIEENPADATAWAALGQLLMSLPKHWEEAETSLHRAVELDPTLVGCWFDRGLIMLANGRAAEAVALCRQVIELDPANAIAWSNLGVALEALNQNGEAEFAYRQAIGFQPAFAPARINLAVLLFSLERFEEAKKLLQEAILLDQKAPGSRLLLARVKQCEGCHEEAEQLARKAIDLREKNPMAWDLLGNILADQLDRTAEAERAYLRAVELAPHMHSALCNLTYLLISQGRFSEAEEHYQKSIAELPPLGAGLLRVFWNLGQSNLAGALAELESVLKADDPGLFSTHRDDLLRCLRFAASKGWGGQILDWLAGSGFADRYRPVWVAYDAYLHGEERLLDVNPEVRAGARRLYNELLGSKAARALLATSPVAGKLKAQRRHPSTRKKKRQ